MQMELPGLDPGPFKKTEPGGGATHADRKSKPPRSRSKSGQLVLPGTVLRLAPQAEAKDDPIPRKRVA